MTFLTLSNITNTSPVKHQQIKPNQIKSHLSSNTDPHNASTLQRLNIIMLPVFSCCLFHIFCLVRGFFVFSDFFLTVFWRSLSVSGVLEESLWLVFFLFRGLDFGFFLFSVFLFVSALKPARCCFLLSINPHPDRSDL